MARLRLRFLLQELDLPVGTTVIGRSAECHITIEDPLVSREHAHITSDGQTARLRDLGSRNGVRLNGHALRGEQELVDGDRIRVGKQEMVFISAAPVPRTAKTTGSLRHCLACRLPYAQESGSCPNCGASTVSQSDETQSFRIDEPQGPDWQLSLSLDLLRRCLEEGRIDDSERVLARTRAHALEGVSASKMFDLAILTARVALVGQNVAWACWAVDLFAAAFASEEAGDDATGALTVLSQLLAQFPVEVGAALRDWVNGPTFSAASSEKQSREVTLRAIRGLLAPSTPT